MAEVQPPQNTPVEEESDTPSDAQVDQLPPEEDYEEDEEDEEELDGDSLDEEMKVQYWTAVWHLSMKFTRKFLIVFLT